MRQMLKNVCVVNSVTFLVALAMCIGGGVTIDGWLLWYFGALAVISVLGMGALVHER